MPKEIKDDLTKRMTASCDVFGDELKGLRVGRASTQLLEPVMVEAYGGKMPLPQVGSIVVMEPRMLGVQVWDSGLVRSVDKAIREAGLGLNPAIDGTLVRVPLPELTQERRTELVKLAHKYAEGTRVAVRAIRRDGMDNVKRKEKEKALSEDEANKLVEEVQKITDTFIQKIEAMALQKEKDILSI
jgi:ribosome recycling factor